MRYTQKKKESFYLIIRKNGYTVVFGGILSPFWGNLGVLNTTRNGVIRPHKFVYIKTKIKKK
jgi:hypothetical protein